MGKDIFEDSNLVDKIKLRKERKITFIFIITSYLLEGLGLALLAVPMGCVDEHKGLIKYTELPMWALILGIIGIIILVLSLTCVIVGLVALKRLTKIVCKKSNKSFIIDVILIAFGYFSYGIFTIIALFKIWLDTRKFLVSDSKEIK